MNASFSPANSPAAQIPQPEGIKLALDILEHGINGLFKMHAADLAVADTVSQLKACLLFIRQLRPWLGKIPASRGWDMVYSLVRQCNRWIRKNWETAIPLPPELGFDGRQSAEPFLSQALFALGPEVNLSADHMALSIAIAPDIASRWSYERLREWLSRCGLTTRMEESNLKKALESSRFGQMTRVAYGKEPIPGRDAEIEDCLSAPAAGQRVPLPTNPDEVPLLFRIIKANQILMKKHATVPGQPGFDLFGVEIPATPGLDLSFPSLPHCVVDDTGMELRASVNGFAYKENQKTIVIPAELIESNIYPVVDDRETEESLAITGDIETGSTLVSGGIIAVEGSIRGAKVTAKKSVLCRAGMVGEEKAEIHAGEDVITAHIHNATVTAENTIVIFGPASKSQLSARRIYCEGASGKILGGKVEAWEDISAQTIGSELGIETELCLGNEFDRLREEVTRLEELIREKKQQKEKYENYRKKILEKLPPPTPIPPPVQAQIDQLTQLVEVLEGEIHSVQQELDGVVQDYQHSKKCVRTVRAREAIHPGTIIRMCGKTLVVKDPLGPSTVVQEDDMIFTLPYQERMREEESEK